jgi:hypothetical protein
MSERNGDKARFGRERKKKILLRKRIRELRKALKNKAAELTPIEWNALPGARF